MSESTNLPGSEQGKGLLETLIDSLRLAECTARHQQESIESLTRRVVALEEALATDTDETES